MALEEILERKRADVGERKARRTLESFVDALEPSDRSLEAALRAPRAGFICECKRSSPSQGQIREDFVPVDIARSYAPFADAISVLTDEPYFGGRFEYLREVREAADVPVLCKDFVVDPYQVYEARGHGADAILLMLSVLDDEAYGRCFEVARRLGMDVLTEVHDAAELDRALAHPCAPPIIGINNRNLKTLDVDLGVTERLAPKVPADRVIVCESGVKSHRDTLRLRGHCDAFLVGTALMGAPDLDRAVRELVFGEVKVCGLTRPEDAKAAFDAGASLGGLIFAEESPRCVTEAQAREVREVGGLGFVGVFVNAEVDEVAGKAAALGLAAVQLHGDEDDAYVDELRQKLPGATAIWQVGRVANVLPDVMSAKADRVLLDTFAAGKRGGTGERFDWSLLAGLEGLEERVVLSGGLGPDNAGKADRVGARALDVNSGVEQAPGIKDSGRLEQFFAALRGRGRRT
ncbi:bifunctional indole-3-glycerol-phosphate synthase TrpC/phosphoribosylanthranilate isomerase TrpF [Persicimonas caeni]|uniref:Multifunctional fusion protein n=1 Tax=Persicimonas caeni TaxID=2292766 RepID=A0A4Y6Q0Z0_PERCE|nr:bifunctional indole-3-glycerol-phosphate synthase TrpC/phosphoribosylanthranilate isomerase TrpF [Persicimonas caeni]QDG54248.1 bifunctional indole-3-glycerol-phosphate synthase TrpC/phosphoribosylanthranilate isomerase TrpF [Persicimonas caeni]QED35469.1 bifunctional indole-3-glycerol-phosphate synthase TrpC/phosphoribosylanthranilate isomerase TrpF [Persicimonas caeni]